MRLRIQHKTTYRYDQPIAYAIQSLRMMPRGFDGQGIENWSVTVANRHQPLPAFIDGYGNWVQLFTRNSPHSETVIEVNGVVDVADRHGLVAGADEPLPPAFYLRRTPLTRADGTIAEMARGVPKGDGPVDQLHGLMKTIRERIDYRAGETDAETTAPQALAAGLGVCQDHAHVMISGARTLGYPGRYVSGYLEAGADAANEATHAWAEVHVPDLGWVGFDPSNCVSPTDRYVRVGVGLDYWSAAPVRGLWRGQAEESLEVAVEVAIVGATQ